MKSDLQKNKQALRNELLASGAVTNVTQASSPTDAIYSNWGVDDFPGKTPDDAFSVSVISVTPDYFQTLGMKLVSGRDFDINNSQRDTLSVILNEAAVKRMRLQKPLDQYITLGGGPRLRIIGVTQDVIMQNPFESVGPGIFLLRPEWTNFLMLRLREDQSPASLLAKIKPIFDKYNPAFPFEYRFADEQYRKKFAFEAMVGRLAGMFALMSIFISCLGLFGLSAYVAEQRTKELGIRKVLGASVPQLWAMLSKEFVLLVVLACLLAAPLAAYFLDSWLKKYTYRIELNWQVFVLAGVLAIGITLLTVSYQALRSALINPVHSLKSE
jgi:putative ABC transport system permease protein